MAPFAGGRLCRRSALKDQNRRKLIEAAMNRLFEADKIKVDKASANSTH